MGSQCLLVLIGLKFLVMMNSLQNIVMYFRCSRPPDVDEIKNFDKEDQAAKQFLNQAHAGHRPTCTWFLKIDPVRIVGMRVCPRPRLLITSGMI